MNFQFVYFDTLTSTNTEAADQARKGADEGLCVVAGEQTAGRGRQGRAWISQKDSGVFLSLVLRPRIDPRHITLIPLLGAVAVHEVLSMPFGIAADIKWPNDVLVHEKKVSGILSEAVETPNGLAVILGIGINVKNVSLPENATSIEAESGIKADRNAIISALTNKISGLYGKLHSRPAAIADEWKKRSSYSENKAVQVRSFGESFNGVTCGLEENGALRVKLADGSVRAVQAGDVERLRGGD